MYVINFDKSKTALSEHKCPACKSEKANALLTVEAENARVGNWNLRPANLAVQLFFLVTTRSSATTMKGLHKTIGITTSSPVPE